MIDDLGLLVSRVVLGGSIASHGAQKAFGAFGGPGPAGAAKFMESIGFAPGERYATAASYGELGSGALLALGLGGPAGAGMLISTMLVAQMTVHAKNGFFASGGGVELGVVYAAGALALASSGYGRFSLDAALGVQRPLRHPAMIALALAGGLAAGTYVLSTRKPGGPDAAS